MRRPTKALSAGSTSGQGSRLGSIRRAFAGRGASSGAGGSGAPSRGRTRVSALALAIAALALLALAPTALAAKTTVNTIGTTAGPDTTFTTYPAQTVDTSCPNQAFRTGLSANLPDCRAYELVTPLDSQPNHNNAMRASFSGDRFSYFSYVVPPGVESFGTYYLASRGVGGWSTRGVIPPQGTVDANLCLPPIVFWSQDFSRGVLADGPESPGFIGQCPAADPPLVDDAPPDVQNLFVSDLPSGTYQLVNVTPPGVQPDPNTNNGFAEPLAVSSDLTHVLFQEAAQLTDDAPPLSTGQTHLYEWSAGTVRLVTVLPDGTPTQGTTASPFYNVAGIFAADHGNPQATHALSEDGSRAFFLVGGNLYLRDHPDRPQSPLDAGGACTDPALACTVQVDAPDGGPGPGGGGTFLWATPDGSRVFFAAPASSGLTDDTQPGSGANLYRYDADTGALADLTPAADARALGVSGTSDNGSYLYFVAQGVLASGATAGEPNLYLRHAAATTFIATLSDNTLGNDVTPRELCDWRPGCLSARVSPDGRFLAFNSIQTLTGYDNHPQDPAACDLHDPKQASGDPCTEIYLYDAGADALSCASCDPSGAPPIGHSWIDASIGTVARLNTRFAFSLSRNLSDDGRVFFISPDALVPADTNGADGCPQLNSRTYQCQDVYEYTGGQPRLLSSGTSSQPSFFANASASGGDVFLRTDDALLAQDTDNAGSIYDARVGGGFPPPPTAPTPCSGDACKGSPSAPAAPPPAASISFSGPGNAAPGAASAKVKVLSRVVHGSTFMLRVKVPGKGRITVTGSGIKSVRRSVAKAGTYKLRVSLTAREKKLLRHKRRLRLKLRVGFAPDGGSSSSATVSLTVKA